MNRKQFTLQPTFTNENSADIINDISTRSKETVSIGETAGKNSQGTNNVFIGFESGFNSVDINDSIFIGSRTGFNVKSSQGNVYIGAETASDNSFGSFNTIAGYNSGSHIQDGELNTIFGTKNVTNNISTFFNNSIFGNNSGKNLISGEQNVVIGNQNINNVENALSNIYIGFGNVSIQHDTIHDSIIMGNNNSIANNSLSIGNYNSIKSESSISIGSRIDIRNVATITDPLIQYDPLIKDIARQRLSISDIVITPENNKNFIYQSLVRSSIPIRSSLSNNIDVQTIFHTIPTLSVSTDKITDVYRYKILEYIPSIENNTVYQIDESIISINSTNTYRNEIDLKTISISNHHEHVNFYVTKQPKYGSITKLKYNKNETIYINEYLENGYIQNDTIEISTITSFPDSEYSILSKKSLTINLLRKTYNPPLSPTLFYTGLINVEWFFPKTSIVINKNSNKAYVDNVIKTTSSFRTNTNVLIDTTSDTTVFVDNKEVHIKHLNNWIDQTFENKTYRITLLPNNRIEHDFIQDLNYKIYIVRPPKYGYLLHNIYQHDLTDFRYILKSIDQTNSDSITVKFLSQDLTKTTEHTYTVIIENFIVNLDRIYWNASQTIITPITLSMLQNGFFWNSTQINHINRQDILPKINNKNFPIFQYDYTISKNISLGVNNLELTIYPYSSVSIETALRELILNKPYVSNTSFYVIKQPNYGSVDPTVSYFNTTNRDDNFQILIAVNPYNASRDNVVDVNIKIINTFEITFSPQYLYNENVAINTISVKDVDINDIYIQNLENVNDSIISIKDSRISRSNSGITKYRLLFGQTDYSIDTFPEINHVVYIDRFHIEYSIPNHVSDINKVCYLLENDRTYNNLNISFILNINTIFDNIVYNRYSFYLVLSDTDFNIHFTENGIYINNVLIDSLGIIPINTTVVVEVSSEIIKIGGIEHRHNVDAYLFNKIELLYTLSDNIQNVDNENYKLTNYTVDVNITNLTITYKIDNGQNLMIGGDVVCSGYNNICLGNNFQSFGNKSIIIGNTIGNTDYSNISIDNGLHESIIIGNTCFNQSPVKNIISIGNNIYNDITLDTINDYSKLSTFFSKNPVLIGNELKYNSDHIININNSIIETDNYISIGKDKKDVLIGNSNIIDLITEQSLDFDNIVKNKQDKIEFQEPLYNSNNIISVDLSSKQDIIDFVYPLSNNDNNIVVDLTHKQDVLEFTYPLKNNSNVIQLDLSNLQTDLQFHEPLSNIDDHVYIDLSHKQDLLDVSYPLCNINNVLSIDLSTKQDLLEFEYPLSNMNGTVNVDISSKQNVLTYSDPINIVDDHISIDLTKKQDILYFQKPLNSFNNIVSIDLSSKQDVLTFQEPLILENTNVSIDISNKQDLLTFQFPLVSNIDGTVSLDISNKQDKLIFKEPILKNENNEVSIDLNSKQDVLVFEEPLSISGNKVNIDLSNKQDNLTFNTPLINNNNVIDLDLTHKQDKLSFEYPLVIDNTSNKLGIDLDHKQDVLVFTDTFVSNTQNKISIDLDHKQNKLSFSDPLKYNDQNLSIDLSHKQDTLQFEHPLSNIDGIVSIKQSIIEFEYPLSNINNVVSIDVNSLQNKLIFENPLYQENDIIKVDLSDINNTYNVLNDHVSNVLQNEIDNKQPQLIFDEPLSISNSNTVSIDLTQKQDIFTVQDPLYFNNNVLSIDTRELVVDITKITQFNGTWNDLYGKPELFPTSWELIQEKPYIFSGSWYDLEYTPTIFPTSWDIIENKPTYFKSNWENIDNKPLSFIADWNNVFNKPTFFNTSWDIIQNKPNLFETEWNKIQNKPTVFDTEWDRVQNKPLVFDTNWNKVQDKPSLFNTEWDRIQNKPDLYSDTDFDSRLSSVISANSVIKFLNGVLYSDLSDYYTVAQVDVNTTNIYNSLSLTQGKITTNNPLNIDSANLLSLNIDSSSLKINENNELSVIGGSNLWGKSNTDIYYNSGKVGIGTSEPYNLLSLYDGEPADSTSIPGMSIYSKYRSPFLWLTAESINNTQIPYLAFSAGRSGYQDDEVTGNQAKNVFISYFANDYMLKIENTQYIQSVAFDIENKRVGIGSINPEYSLDVDGDVNISSGSKYKIDGRDLSLSDLKDNSLFIKKEISLGNSIQNLSSPLGITLSTNSKWLYTTVQDGLIKINTNDDTKTKLVTSQSNNTYDGIVLSKDEKSIYVNVNFGEILQIDINNGDILKTIPTRRDGGDHMFRGITISPDGSTLFVCDVYELKIQMVVVSTKDVSTLLDTSTINEGSFQPQYITISQDGNYLYVTLNKSFSNDKFLIIKINIADGTYEVLLEYVKDTDNTDINFLLGLTLSKDENFLYVCNYLKNNILKVNTTDGNYSVLTVSRSNVIRPSDIVMSSDESILYVSEPFSDEIQRFELIKPITGKFIIASPLILNETVTENSIGLSYDTTTLDIDDNGKLTVIDSSSSVWTESSDNIYRSLGNVGIGTSTPSQKLHVQGHIYTSETIEIEGGTATWKYNSSTQDSSLQKTYITFKPLTTDNDWVYLRQIGGNNAIALSYDFHDDNNDLRMYFRNVISAGSGNDSFTNNFYFNGGSGGSYFHMMNKNTIQSTDSWLRLNQDNHYSSGVYTQYKFRCDGGIECNGPLTITDDSENAGNANSGSLVLQHNTGGGSSSIVFRSKNNAGSDYAYLRYDDNYFGGNEDAGLIIGIENDANDRIRFRTSGYDTITLRQRNVGINHTTPNSKLHIAGSGHEWLQTLEASTAGGSPSNYAFMRFVASSYTWGFRINNAGASGWLETTAESSGDLFLIYESGGLASNGEFQYGGFFERENNSTQINFTGQHRSYSLNHNLYNHDNNGLIVSFTGQYKNLNSQYHYSNRKQNIQIDDALPLVQLSSTSNDKKVWGVINRIEDTDTPFRKYAHSGYGIMTEKHTGDSRLEIQAVGEGGVWVCDVNGNYEAGDYITTCDVLGYGAKQHDDILHSYTLGKITTDVDWNTIEELIPVQIIETYTSNVYQEKTYTCNVEVIEETHDSNLQSNIQMIGSVESNITVNELVEKTFNRVDGYGYPIYVNQLDDDCNIIYDTALEIRYVRQNGDIIDKNTYDIELSSNLNVYKSAFVGCTYTSG